MASKQLGRPLKFTTLGDLQNKIEAYFASCFEEKWFDEDERDEYGNYIMVPDNEGGKYLRKIKHTKKKVLIKTPTVTGLALALDTSRRTLLDYEGGDDDFSHTIKKAKDAIHNFIEQGMVDGEINPTAAIFNLKNNWDWEDKVKTEHSGEINDPYAHLTDEQLRDRIKKRLEGDGQKGGEAKPNLPDGRDIGVPNDGSSPQGSGVVPEGNATEPKGDNPITEKPSENNGDNDSIHNPTPAQ